MADPTIAKPKKFKDLPGFDAALADFIEIEAREGNWYDYGIPLSELGNIVAPCVYRIPNFETLMRFALAISASRASRPPLRLVPSPKPRTFANSIAWANFCSRVLGPMARIAASVANDCEVANGQA